MVTSWRLKKIAINKPTTEAEALTFPVEALRCSLDSKHLIPHYKAASLVGDIWKDSLPPPPPPGPAVSVLLVI